MVQFGCTVCSAGGSWSTNRLIYNAGSSAGDDVMTLTGGHASSSETEHASTGAVLLLSRGSRVGSRAGSCGANASCYTGALGSGIKATAVAVNCIAVISDRKDARNVLLSSVLWNHRSVSLWAGALGGDLAAPRGDGRGSAHTPQCRAEVETKIGFFETHVGCTECSAGGSWSTNQLIYNAGSSAGDDVMSLTRGHASSSETEHASTGAVLLLSRGSRVGSRAGSCGANASCYTGALGSIAAPSADICIAVVINR